MAFKCEFVGKLAPSLEEADKRFRDADPIHGGVFPAPSPAVGVLVGSFRTQMTTRKPREEFSKATTVIGDYKVDTVNKRFFFSASTPDSPVQTQSECDELVAFVKQGFAPSSLIDLSNLYGSTPTDTEGSSSNDDAGIKKPTSGKTPHQWKPIPTAATDETEPSTDPKTPKTPKPKKIPKKPTKAKDPANGKEVFGAEDKEPAEPKDALEDKEPIPSKDDPEETPEESTVEDAATSETAMQCTKTYTVVDHPAFAKAKKTILALGGSWYGDDAEGGFVVELEGSRLDIRYRYDDAGDQLTIDFGATALKAGSKSVVPDCDYIEESVLGLFEVATVPSDLLKQPDDKAESSLPASELGEVHPDATDVASGHAGETGSFAYSEVVASGSQPPQNRMSPGAKTALFVGGAVLIGGLLWYAFKGKKRGRK